MFSEQCMPEGLKYAVVELSGQDGLSSLEQTQSRSRGQASVSKAENTT